jgi:hypothetical protein
MFDVERGSLFHRIQKRDSKPTTGNVGFAAQITTLKGEKTSLQQQILGPWLSGNSPGNFG